MVVHSLRTYPGLHRHPTHTTRLATYCTWLLEVSIILVHMDILTIIHCGLCHITHSRMLEQTDLQLIETILNLPEEETMKKSSLVQLRAVKQKATGIRDKECFCSGVRRKVWYKDFLIWYEANT